MAVRSKLPVIALGSFTSQTPGTARQMNGSLVNASFSVRGTFVATIVLEGSDDGVTYSTINGLNGSAVSLTVPGLINLAGAAAFVRANCSAFTSGTAVASLIIPPEA